MDKTFKTILIISIAVFGFWFLPSTFAQAADLEVQFEQTPLFSETNFLPGESVTRWINVGNNSGETKKIGTEIINKSLCLVNCLSDVLDLVISENGTTLYSGSLTTFYGSGEKILSNLNTGATTKYYFSMTFNPVAGNVYQNLNANFDIKIGFFGEESISQEITPGGGGSSGSFVVSGLIISEETFSSIGINTVTITWNTNLNSTSRVIYSPYGFPHLLQINNPPNYGYVFSTDEDSNKVIKHTVTITGLTSGTTYYYRCVSHGSLAISQEYTFTTKGIAGAVEKIVPEKPEVGVPPTEEEIGIPLAEIEKEGAKEPLPPEELVVEEEEMPKIDLASMLLASLSHSWEGFLGGKFSNNLIFWALIASLGIFLSGLSLIKKPRIIFSLLGFLGIWSVLISSFFLPLPIVEQLRMPLPNFIVLPIGVLFFLVGVLVIYLAFRHLSFRGASNLEKPKELITSGVYGVVRHPLYFGLILAYLGWCLIFKAFLAILLIPIILIFLLILILLEEKELIRKFGLFYKEYQKNAPWRLIPKIF